MIEKPFMVYTNSLVDRLDIWIYSNWGQLIYSCSKENLLEGEGIVSGMEISMAVIFRPVAIQ